MLKCSDYEELEVICNDQYYEILSYFPITCNKMQTLYDVCQDMNNIDAYANQSLPFDIPGHPNICALKVYGDGNCFARSLSYIAYGCQDHYVEMRARVTMELVVHKETYLNPDYLLRGTSSKKNLAETYATYVEEYKGERVKGRPDVVEKLYKTSVFMFRKSGVFASMFEMCAGSTVLCINLFSVYPMMGYNVRADMHRLVVPRAENPSGIGYIMWTNTNQLSAKDWAPNHLVPVFDLNTRRDRC
jgi:hypothetical protein